MLSLVEENYYNICKNLNIVDIYNFSTMCKKTTCIKKSIDLVDVACYACAHHDNLPDSISYMLKFTDINWNIYAYCAENGYKNHLKNLCDLDDGTTLNDKLKYIVSMYAANNCQIEIINWLLTLGISNSKIFGVFANKNNIEVAYRVILHDNYPNDKKALKYKLGVVYQLIMNDNMESLHSNIETIITIIHKCNKVKHIVKLLMDHGGINVIQLFVLNCDIMRHTIIHDAIFAGRADVVHMYVNIRLYDTFPYFRCVIKSDNLFLLNMIQITFDKNDCAYYAIAVRNGSLNAMDKLYRMGAVLHDDIFKWALHCEDMRIIEWLIIRLCPCSRMSAIKSVKLGYLNVVKYYRDCCNHKLDSEFYDAAIFYNNLTIIKWMFRVGIKFSQQNIVKISKSENYELINWFWNRSVDREFTHYDKYNVEHHKRRRLI